jgi:hypothetical protein
MAVPRLADELESGFIEAGQVPVAVVDVDGQA